MAGIRLKRGSAQDELRQLEDRRTKLAGEIARAEAELEQADADAAAATRLVAAARLDDGDGAAATKARQNAETRRNAAVRDLQDWHEALVLLDRRLDDQREAVQQEQLAAELAALEKDVAARTEISTRFASAVERAVVELRALTAARENVRARKLAVKALDGDSVGVEADEAMWPDAQELVEMLTSGKPLRPVEKREQAARQRELDEANAPRRARVVALEQTRALALTSWGPEEMERNRVRFFAGLPDDVRDEAAALYESVRADLPSRRRGSERV